MGVKVLMHCPENYLNPETRCDFYVSEKRKKIWLVLLELLSEIDRICKKNDLKYFAANGTLLGAVRHNGFIPWDDDLDIVMPRKDYNRLIQIAEKEFQYPFFLQVSANESDYYRNYIRLRNEKTTAISLIDLNHKSSKGIFIDIFPIDGCNKNIIFQRVKYAECKLMDILLTNYIYINEINNHKTLRKIMYVFTSLFYKIFGSKSLINKLEKSRAEDSFENSDMVQEITHQFEETILKREIYDGNALMDFEFIKIPVPIGYKAILNSVYGDYMKYPPIEKRGKKHEIFFDPDRSYIEYEGKLVKEEVMDKLNEY